MLELLKETKVNKSVKTFQLNSGSPVTIKATYENGKLKDAVFHGNGPGKEYKSYPVVVKDAFWEMIKTMNPWWTVQHKFGWTDVVIEAKEALKLDKIDLKNIIYQCGSNHMVYDHTGKPIAMPYAFDYIDSPFTNDVIDLEKALKHLKKHKWVLNKEDLRIADVPYYNNESGTKKWITGSDELPYVVVLPDQKTYEHLYELAKGDSTVLKGFVYGDKWYNWKLKKENCKDYLGMRQFSIVKD